MNLPHSLATHRGRSFKLSNDKRRFELPVALDAVIAIEAVLAAEKVNAALELQVRIKLVRWAAGCPLQS